jgi:prepilin-type N-terminal cleavage/methylation domain-containing protein/prepilin-type processing-associated H-X9-DG protein
MTKSSPPPADRAFTLIELLVVIAGIVILMALAVPALTSALEKAKSTKDMSNLRQIGTATQLYMNENNGVFPGSATVWMAQLAPKYLSTWRILESPFDARPTSDQGGGANAMVSYGINSNVYSGGAAISTDKIIKPTAFIVFAPAQESGTTTSFQGIGTSAAPGVTVLGATSTPGGAATGGTHNNRKKVNAIFADWHVESMLWNGTGPAFTNTASTGTDPDGDYRWCPQPPCP